ncbi:MAG: zinc ABC transporter substrate-binding protein [Lactobacillaceae bacterium]|jgi:iron/zinc/copper transport system substrate-binding protein|nr:zinc ABC transporter substrate-binding protein [Lactobacillaceae bacterium]
MKKVISLVLVILVAVGAGLGIYFSNSNHSNNGRDDKNRLNVVSSFSIINSIVQEVGGKYVNAHSITAIGADQHDYEPTPTDVSRTQNAAIVFSNGLNLEKGGSGWFDKLMKSTNQKSVDVTSEIKTIKLTTKGVAGLDNPHAWNGILEGIQYTKNIEKVLSKKDPKHEAYYRNRAKAFENKLQALFEKWNEKFSSLPADKKILVTQEAAMTYFARDFNLQTYFIWEIDTESNGTPAQIKTLVDNLKGKNITSVFTEQGESTKPMQSVIKQIGAKISGELWTDSVSKKDGVVPTYYDLLNYNAKTIYEGLSK